MASTTWTRLRRAVAARGFTPASWIPAASEGRAEEATIRPARLVEQGEVGGIAVGLAEPWPDPVAFLDGMQRYEVMAYAGASPVVVAEVAGAVLERHHRQLHAALATRRRLVIARPAVLADLGEAIEDYEAIPLPEDGPPHPVHDFLLARREVDAARGRLEVELGHSFRARSDAWLIVDGTLTESPQWAADGRMLGVSKSHATLPFADTTWSSTCACRWAIARRSSSRRGTRWHRSGRGHSGSGPGRAATCCTAWSASRPHRATRRWRRWTSSPAG